MKNLSVIFWALFLSFSFTACKTNLSQNEQASHIPSDANYVITLHLKNLLQKLENGNIPLESLFSSGQNPAQRISKAKEAININQPVYYFSKTKNTIAGGLSSYKALVATLKNESAVNQYLSQFEPGATIKKTEKFSFVNAENSLIGWSDNTIIFLWDGGNEEILSNLFIQNKELSIASNEAFNKSITNTSDADFFINTASLALANPTLAVSKLSLLLKDTYTSGSLFFNNGSVDGEMQTIYGAELQQMIKNNPSFGTNINAISSYPENAQAISVLSINPDLLKSIIEYAGIHTVIDQYLSGMNISVSEIINALNGNMYIVASNLLVNNSNKFNFSSLVSGNFISVIDIKNKSVFDKITNAFATLGMLNLSNGTFALPSIGKTKSKGLVKVENDKIIYASSLDFLNRYFSDKNPITVPPDIVNILNNKVFSIYADGKILDQNTFKNFYFYQDKINGVASKGAIKLNLISQQESSLPAIIKYFTSTSRNNLSNDTTTTTISSPSEIPAEDVIADTNALKNLERP